MMPVVMRHSQATRPWGSWLKTASRTASLTWSQILSGCPSETDSEVKMKSAEVWLELMHFLPMDAGSDRGAGAGPAPARAVPAPARQRPDLPGGFAFQHGRRQLLHLGQLGAANGAPDGRGLGQGHAQAPA